MWYSLGEELRGIVLQDRAASALQDRVAPLFAELRALSPASARGGPGSLSAIVRHSQEGRKYSEPTGLDISCGAQFWIKNPGAAEFSGPLRRRSGVAACGSGDGSGTESDR